MNVIHLNHAPDQCYALAGLHFRRSIVQIALLMIHFRRLILLLLDPFRPFWPFFDRVMFERLHDF